MKINLLRRAMEKSVEIGVVGKSITRDFSIHVVGQNRLISELNLISKLEGLI